MKTRKLLSKSNEKSIPFSISITGASRDILQNCSATCRNAFSYAGLTLIFTPLISALIIAYAVSTFALKSIYIFPVIFCLWLAFIYLFDRLVIVSDNHVTRWVRVAAIIVLALFHSFIWDTLTLQDDIMASMRKEYNNKVQSINSNYDKQVSVIQTKIDTLSNRNQAISDKQRAYIDSLQTEGRGLGGSHKYGISTVYNNLEELKNEYKTTGDADKAYNENRISDYEYAIAAINEARNSEISLVVKPGEAGLMEQVHKMHQLVFIEGSVTEILFFLIWFGLFCFLEALPLLTKIVFQHKMKEYFKAQDADQENAIKAFDTRKLNDWTVIQSELQFDLQLRLSQIASDSFIKKIEIDKQGIRNRLKILDDFLCEIEEIENELRKLYPNNYYEYVRPEIEKARNDFVRSMSLN